MQTSIPYNLDVPDSPIEDRAIDEDGFTTSLRLTLEKNHGGRVGNSFFSPIFAHEWTNREDCCHSEVHRPCRLSQISSPRGGQRRDFPSAGAIRENELRQYFSGCCRPENTTKKINRLETNLLKITVHECKKLFVTYRVHPRGKLVGHLGKCEIGLSYIFVIIVGLRFGILEERQVKNVYSGKVGILGGQRIFFFIHHLHSSHLFISLFLLSIWLVIIRPGGSNPLYLTDRYPPCGGVLRANKNIGIISNLPAKKLYNFGVFGRLIIIHRLYCKEKCYTGKSNDVEVRIVGTQQKTIFFLLQNSFKCFYEFLFEIHDLNLQKRLWITLK